jgi:flagellar biosynthesis/type III secretory pathway protein FliH
MPAKILKADSIIVSFSKSGPPAKNDNLDADQPAGPLDGKEFQAVMAEAKLTIYKLLNDAKRQAGALIAQAKAQANQILEQAAAEKDLVTKSAYQSGYEAGQAALQSERDRLLEERMAQTQAIDQERSRLIGELEPALIELSQQIARKIIHAELKLAPEQIAKIAGAVLSKVVESDNVTLKVSADDYAAVTDAMADRTGSGARVRFRVDHDLKSGDCLAVTPHGTVDGTVEGQLSEIRHRLMEAAENG